MATRDLHSCILQKSAKTFAAISTNTTTTGTIIDTSGFESVEFVMIASAYTDGTYDFTITEGDDSGLSDGTTVAADDLLGLAADATITAANAPKRIGYRGGKRYVRLNIVSTSVSSGATLGAVAIMSFPRSEPTVA